MNNPLLAMMIVLITVLSLPQYLVLLFWKGYELPPVPGLFFYPLYLACLMFFPTIMSDVPAMLSASTVYYAAFALYGGKNNRRR
jgi:hypothetical protein